MSAPKATAPDLWVWSPEKGGYEPRSDDWWEWDADKGVMRPRERDGWKWDPKRRVWVDTLAGKAN